MQIVSQIRLRARAMGEAGSWGSVGEAQEMVERIALNPLRDLIAVAVTCKGESAEFCLPR
jgi:hypothetical protein